MKSKLLSRYAMTTNDPEPAFAAALSLMPGLGQFYNGERRKAWLFLDVGIINLVLIAFMFSADALVRALTAFSQEHHFKANEALLRTLQSMHIGSAASNLLILLCGLFVLYAARDAYDRAVAKRRSHIYPDHVMELSEAASGSYLMHFALMMTCAIMAAFVFIPKPERSQLLEIEFVNTERDEVKTQKDLRIAPHSTIAKGKADRSKPVNASSPSRASQSQPETRPVSEPKVEPVKTTPAPAKAVEKPVETPPAPPAPPKLAFNPPVVRPAMVSPVTPRPAVPAPPSPQLSNANLGAAPALPRVAPVPVPGTTAQAPVIPIAAPGNTGTIPVPQLAMAIRPVRPGGGPVFERNGARSSGSNSGVTQAPAPVNIGSADGSGHDRGKPTLVETDAGHKGARGPAAQGPQPIAVEPSNGPSGIVVTPRLDGPSSAVTDNGTPNTHTDGVPREQAAPGTQRSVDFGRYLAELQKRIKRAWFPPRNPTSQRSVAHFTITKSGELRQLKLIRSSGSAAMDQAALKSVENAAPFPPLPQGSPDEVEVEFTFDYNVFGGSRPGSF
ncbi:MAG TPA: TonB family protein [Candidatus Obscuribacterales bacterium]